MPGSLHIGRVLKLKIVVELCLLNFQLIRVITKDEIVLKLISCQILEKATLTSLSSGNFTAEKRSKQSSTTISNFNTRPICNEPDIRGIGQLVKSEFYTLFVSALICSSLSAILSLSSLISMIFLDFLSRNRSKSSNSDGLKYFCR